MINGQWSFGINLPIQMFCLVFPHPRWSAVSEQNKQEFNSVCTDQRFFILNNTPLNTFDKHDSLIKLEKKFVDAHFMAQTQEI